MSDLVFILKLALSFACFSVKAVPRLATTFVMPDLCGATVSIYPSTIITCNLSFENYLGVVGVEFDEDQIEKLKKDKKGNLILTDYGTLAVEFGASDDKRNYRDGDASSLFDTDYPLDTVGLSEERKATIKHDPSDILIPRINDETRVYKGGSWKDRIYWLNPSTRRFMQQDECSNTVGFRCAMSQLGTEGQNLK